MESGKSTKYGKVNTTEECLNFVLYQDPFMARVTPYIQIPDPLIATMLPIVFLQHLRERRDSDFT